MEETEYSKKVGQAEDKLKINDYDSAMSIFEEAKAIDPLRSEAYLGLARCHSKNRTSIEHVTKALNNYESALNTSDDDNKELIECEMNDYIRFAEIQSLKDQEKQKHLDIDRPGFLKVPGTPNQNLRFESGQAMEIPQPLVMKKREVLLWIIGMLNILSIITFLFLDIGMWQSGEGYSLFNLILDYDITFLVNNSLLYFILIYGLFLGGSIISVLSLAFSRRKGVMISFLSNILCLISLLVIIGLMFDLLGVINVDSSIRNELSGTMPFYGYYLTLALILTSLVLLLIKNYKKEI